MPIKRPDLINNEIYHIVIRGVGDSLIFKDKNDYYRAIFSLYEFNTTELVSIREKRQLRRKTVKGLTLDSFKKRDLLVEILAFCLMPNHIHLLLNQFKDKGVSQFVRKFGSGYVTYFNKKYQRIGHLFGRFRVVHVKDDEQLKNVFVYIHANPISLIEPKWREKGISNPEKVIDFLEEYKWSSYLDYIGKKNFPSLTNKEFISKVMGNENNCKKFVESWIRYHFDFNDFKEMALE